MESSLLYYLNIEVFVPEPRFDYQARRSEGFRLNFEHLGFLNVQPMNVHGFFISFISKSECGG